MGTTTQTYADNDLTQNTDRNFMLACYLINSELHDLEELKKIFVEAMDLSKRINIKQTPTRLHPYLDAIINDTKSEVSIVLTGN